MRTMYNRLRRRMSRRPAIFASGMAATVGALTLAIGAPAAQADTPCQDRSTSAAFSFVGDSNQYFAAPNGSFDTTAEWSHYGSWMANGVGSPVNLARGIYTRSDYMPAGSTTTSTWTCVRGNEDTIRFLVKPSGANGNLKLRLYVSDPNAYNGMSYKDVVISPTSPGTPYGASGWYVTPRISIPWSPYWDNTQWILFQFSSEGTSGGWYVDDMMIDPWRTN